MALSWGTSLTQTKKGKALSWDETFGEPTKTGTSLTQERVEFLHSSGIPTIGQAPPKEEIKDNWLKKIARIILPRNVEVRLGITEPNYWDLVMQHEDDRMSYLRTKQFEELYKREVIEAPQIPIEYKEPTGFAGQFIEGLKEGYIGTVKAGFGYFAESFGRQVGSPERIKWGANLGDRAIIELIKRPELLEPEDLKPFLEGGWLDSRWYGRRIGQMLPYMGMTTALATLGGLAGGPAGASAAAYGSAFVLEKGNSYKRYLDEGVPPDKAAIYSSVYGAIAATIENSLGVSPAKIGTKVATKGVERVVYDSYKSYLMKEIPKIGIKTLKMAMGEGGEEVAQSIAENLILKFYKTEAPILSKNLSEEFMSAFVGSFPFGLVNISIPEIRKFTPEQVTKIEEKIKKTDEALQKQKQLKVEVKPIQKELEPLAEEARKYKSAEEFIKAQGTPVYHGTTIDFERFSLENLGQHGRTEGSGIYFTDSKELAQRYAGDNGRVIESYIKLKKPITDIKQKTVTKAQLKKILSKVLDYNREAAADYGLDINQLGKAETVNQWAKILREMEDVDIDIPNELINAGSVPPEIANKIFSEVTGYDGVITKWGNRNEKIIVVFNPDNILTKSQLIDIWKEANKKLPKPEVKTEIQQEKLVTETEEVKPALKETKFPENNYKLELLEEINKLEELPKIDPAAFEWKPPVANNNPYSRVMYDVWNKMIKMFDSKAPLILKESATQEISNLLKEKQHIYDGLTKRYYDEIVKPITKLTTEEKQKIGQMIYKRINIPPEYKSAIKDIDVKIGQLGQSIVDLDQEMIKNKQLSPEMQLLTEETWLSNLGEYARTLYVKVDPITGKPKIIPRSAFTKEGVIDRSAFKRKLTDAEWGANALVLEGKTLEEIQQYTMEELNAIGREAKERYGLTFQADYILARTFKDLSKARATRLFQKAIVENPRLFTKDVKIADKMGFVSVQKILPRGTKSDVRLGPLNFGYIHPGLQEELRGFVFGDTHDAVMSIFQEPLSWWKIFKVALNLPTVIRNFLAGAFIQTDFAGYPVWVPKNALRYIRAVKAYFTKDDTYKNLRDHGQYGSDYFDVEIEEDEMSRIIAKAEKSKNPMATYSRELLSKLGDQIKDAKKIASYYGHIDHIQRTYLAMSALEDGASINQAVNFANKWELDYRFAPKFVESLRSGLPGWLFPFLSFYVLMAPRIAEVLVTRPWVLLKYPIIIGAFNAIAITMLGADDDEVENAKPDWLKDKDYVVTLPFRDSEGNFVFLDLDYTLPFGGPSTLFLDWNQILMMAKSPGMMSIIINLLNNYDNFTDRKIYNETDTMEDKSKKVAEYVVRNLGPGFVTHALNIFRAAKGETIGFPIQRERDLAQSVARALGVSMYSGGFNEAYGKIRALIQEINDIQWSMKILMSNPNIPIQEKNRKIIEYQDEIRRRAEKIQEIGRNMPKTVASPKEKTKIKWPTE